jgi:carbamoyltransferase
VDHIVFYDKPFLKFERLLETYLAFAPRGFRSFATSLPVWLKDKLFQKSMIAKALTVLMGGACWTGTSGCCFPNIISAMRRAPFSPRLSTDAAVLTMDGVGEWTTTSLAWAAATACRCKRKFTSPIPSACSIRLSLIMPGFKVNSGEYKVMGLAPYGEPKYAGQIKDHLIDIKDDGSFALDMSYFNYCTGLTMTNAKFDALFGGPPRQSEVQSDPAGNGSSGLDPGRHRRGGDQAGAWRRREPPVRKTSAWPAAWR